jgi:hypothetical protein
MKNQTQAQRATVPDLAQCRDILAQAREKAFVLAMDNDGLWDHYVTSKELLIELQKGWGENYPNNGHGKHFDFSRADYWVTQPFYNCQGVPVPVNTPQELNSYLGAVYNGNRDVSKCHLHPYCVDGKDCPN